MKGYYFITDAALSRAGNRSDVAQAVATGVQLIQYRAKGLPTQELYAEAKELRALCQTARFLVNDGVDIALAVNADGVHLGQEDLPLPAARKLLGPARIIGVTVHNLDEARAAEKGGADYVAVSPVFSTLTKPDAGAPAGVELVEQIHRSVRLPIVAIGGITLSNAPKVIRAGANCVCAISAVVTHQNVREAIEEFQRLFRP